MATRVSTSGKATREPLSRARRRVAAGLVLIGSVLLVVWLAWRLATLDLHPVPIVALLIELSGWTGGLAVALGLLGATSTREERQVDGTYRYAIVVAERVGRTRATDLHRDLRTAVERLTTNSAGGPADRAMIGVLVDGPRRIALVAMLSIALLLGVAPLDVPPGWALLALGAGTALVAASHVVASEGRIRFGDRTRWSFASLGEVLATADRVDQAPRRWVGTVGTIVVLNLAIALRGMSDRWTHGLPAMTDDERLVAMVWAGLLVLGGLYTLRTIPAPRLGNAHLVSRRLEERGARQSALGVAVCLGLVGLIAGILPGSVDPGTGDPSRVEPPAQIEAGGDVGD
jgi:hypothetical protein